LIKFVIGKSITLYGPPSRIALLARFFVKGFVSSAPPARTTQRTSLILIRLRARSDVCRARVVEDVEDVEDVVVVSARPRTALASTADARASNRAFCAFTPSLRLC
jgi:hypothetical protein